MGGCTIALSLAGRRGTVVLDMDGLRQTAAGEARRGVLPRLVRRALRRVGSKRRETTPGILSKWQRVAPALLRYGATSIGNRVEVFCDGDDAFEHLWRDIDAAQTRVVIEVYTFDDDRVGRRTLDALLAAARRGCETLLIVDAVGSHPLPHSAVQPLIDAGVRFHRFNPLRPSSGIRPLLRRDHRKITVIDDHVAWCGGMNISEDYAGHRHGLRRFRDCVLRVQGPAAVDLLKVTASSLAMMKGVDPPMPITGKSEGGPEGTLVQVLSSAGARGRRTIQRALRLTISHAVDRCFITTPYFVPPFRLRRAITRAAARGVDVRVLTAGISDVPIVHLASQHIYGQLLRRGVRIYELQEGVIHAKTLTVDGVYSTVGSFNLDHWSDKRNLEVNVAVLDEELASTIQDHFAAFLEDSSEVTIEYWSQRALPWRLVHFLAYQLMRI